MKTLPLFAAFALLATAALADPFNPSRIAGEARWVAHFDMDGMKTTQIGAFLAERVNRMIAEQRKDALKNALGFNPSTDLRSVTFYGRGPGPSESVALVRGTFKVPEFVALLKTCDSYQTLGHGSHLIHSWKAQHGKDRAAGHTSYAAQHPDGTLVMGQGVDQVKSALDVLDGLGSNLGGNAFFTQLGSLPGAPLFAAAADQTDGSAFPPRAAVLRQADRIQFAMAEQGGTLAGMLDLHARDAETTLRMQQLLNGMAALLLLRGEENPGLAELASSSRVSQESPTHLRVHLAYPVAELIRLATQREQQ